MVALPESNALHPAETFPWDKTKRVYMLNSYHGLHCLVRTYRSLYTSCPPYPSTLAMFYIRCDVSYAQFLPLY